MLTAELADKTYYSLDEDWDYRKEEYRALLNKKAVCPLCKEPIICKFGSEKIHHFAHSQNADCPSTKDNERHMKGVGLLYKNFLSNIDEYGLSHVRVNRVFEEKKLLADLELEFTDGKRCIIEFYAGHLKKKDIEMRNDLYEKTGIPVIWIIDSGYLEYIKDCIKLSPTMRKMKKINEVDKFYVGSWRELILEDGLITDLPTKEMASGTIIHLDIQKSEISIFRALSYAGHTGLYFPRKVLSGNLSDVNFTRDLETLYFDEEKELGDAYKEAKRKLKTLIKELKLERLKVEKEMRIAAKANNHKITDHHKEKRSNVKFRDGFWNKDSKGFESYGVYEVKSKEDAEKELKKKWFTCRRCLVAKKEDEMSSYSLSSKKGVCEACETDRQN